MNELRGIPHRRYDPLRGEWVLVSPQRLQRPWLGETAPAALEQRAAYDPDCYLCPGNARANGERNPQYEGTFVFENDYAALKLAPVSSFEDGLLLARSESGRCRVLCFSPRHDTDIAQMAAPEIRAVVDAWAEQFVELGALERIRAVTIFENRGAMMGASNPHPHGQIWANESIPGQTALEQRSQEAYAAAHGVCLLCAYVRQELDAGERLIHVNEHAAAVVPFWAVWPYEALVLPRRHVRSLEELAGEERDALADVLGAITARYDRVFSAPFPYSMGFHQRPTDGNSHDAWHLHAHYFPPLLRSSSVRKYMVGYELLAEAQRDLTPEEAAERLRSI